MTKKSILLIDDCAHNLKLKQFLVSESGFEVETAERRADTRRTETSCPGSDPYGYPTPWHARARLNSRSAPGLFIAQRPIIAFTASAHTGDEEMARVAGCDGYITKPVSTRTFVNVLHKYFVPD